MSIIDPLMRAPIFDPDALSMLRKSFDATNRIRVHRSIGTHLPHEAEP